MSWRISRCRPKRRASHLTIDRPGLPLALGDRFVLRQALINIVDNAVKFTGAGGKIHIRVLESQAGAIIDVATRDPAWPPIRVRIFDRHQSGKSGSGKGRGTGLGLSIAK
jgi:signal transduction histidine kinase